MFLAGHDRRDAVVWSSNVDREDLAPPAMRATASAVFIIILTIIGLGAGRRSSASLTIGSVPGGDSILAALRRDRHEPSGGVVLLVDRENVVDKLARYINQKHPDIKGFTRRSLFRMRQFYETYCNDKKVSPLVRQLSWTHNLLILSRAKRPEEREFYLRLATQKRCPVVS